MTDQIALWLDPAGPLDDRVGAAVASLTRADLEALALGDFSPLEARGIPGPDYVDSGTGLRGVDGATAFPNGISLAATFDVDLARRYGRAVGEEARAAGFPVVLGPTVDLARDPQGGRVGEAFGEDPVLAGLIGAAHVSGLQSAHVIAQVKHYVAYNGECRRTGLGPDAERSDGMNVQIDESQLHDVYLRPFEAVARAGAWSMMGSYNLVNGTYVCEERDLLDAPRRLWGWKGFYCPDFIFAVRDPAKALAAGLDLGALGGAGGRTSELVAAAADEVLRSAAANVIRALIGSGVVDHPLTTAIAPSTSEHLLIAKSAAVAGSVLLANDGVLPLAPAPGRVALIGCTGADALYVGGGAASVSLTPSRIITPRDALIDALDGQVRVAQGSLGDVALPLIPASALQLPDGSGPGVLVDFADGDRVETRILPQVDFDLGAGAGGWPRRWQAQLMPAVSGPHRLSLTLGGAATVTINGAPVILAAREAERFIYGPLYPAQAVVELEAGTPADLVIEYEFGPGLTIPPMGISPSLRLGWQEPDALMDEAVATAAACDVAVVVVQAVAGEGMDRDSLDLPGDQELLIERVAETGTPTVVVVNAPGAVLMPWRERVSAILHVWYPGEQFGPALADLLTGVAEPGGRLPVTIPRERAHLPGPSEEGQFPASTDYRFDDGIGYRSPAVLSQGASFPFGFGLGYAATSSEVTALETPAGLALTVAASNLSDRPTCHVAQVYVEVHGSQARELVGVVRIPLEDRGRGVASLTVGPDSVRRWDARAGRRVPVAGTHTVRVAQHAEDPGVAFPWSVP